MAERPKVLWLHTQPEHYFNVMMDDLAKAGDVEYVAAFSHKGAGVYTERSVPTAVRTVFLREPEGGKRAGFFGKHHLDWREDLADVKYDAAIVSGYGSRVHREVIADCKRRGIPVAMWSDSNLRSQRGKGYKARLRRRLKKMWLRKIIRQTDYMLTTSSLGVGYWRYYGCPARKIVLCPYYSDYGKIATAVGETRSEVLGRVELAGNNRVLFTAARLVRVKGLDLAIRAFMEGGFGERGWTFVIAGAGELEQELKSMAGKACGEAVRFVGFQQPSVNLALMAHADLFILPSRYEPHGIVIQEAMAAGTPVLASDVCGAGADLIEAGVSGETFRSEDVGSLRRKMNELMDSPGKLAGMRAGARRIFEEWFERSSPVKVVDQVVREMTANKKAGARR